MPPTYVLYDGQCSLCRRSVEQLARRDTRRALELRDLHATNLQQLHPALTREACVREMHVVTADGRVLAGFDAFRYLWRQLPSTRWWAWVLYVPPAPLAGRLVYRWIARHRLALRCGCDTGTCNVHSNN